MLVKPADDSNWAYCPLARVVTPNSSLAPTDVRSDEVVGSNGPWPLISTLISIGVQVAASASPANTMVDISNNAATSARCMRYPFGNIEYPSSLLGDSTRVDVSRVRLLKEKKVLSK